MHRFNVSSGIAIAISTGRILKKKEICFLVILSDSMTRPSSRRYATFVIYHIRYQISYMGYILSCHVFNSIDKVFQPAFVELLLCCK